MSGASPGLAYEDTPPLSAPLRFFLTAPLFGIAAGAVLLVDGAVLSSRWTPGALAVVHLIAAGFMLQVMLGALLQILPVVAGARFPAPLRVAGATHALLAAGAAALAWGLGRGSPGAIVAGALLLLGGLALFLGAAALGLRRAPAAAGNSRTPRDLRLALVALGVTAALGLLLALALGRGLALPLPLPTLVDVHAGWGWMGWAAVLLAGTSWVVVPMFQITPAYPPSFTASWAPAVLTTLVLWSAAMVASVDVGIALAAIALLALAAGFAGVTLNLQSRSRRSRPDAPFIAFRQAMLAAFGGLAVLLASLAYDAEQLPVLAGVLILHGAFGGAISAMLYKIVPFLSWLHLTQQGIKAPNMKKLLPDGPVRSQLRLRTLTLATLLAAVFVAPAGHAAGLLMMIEFAWLLLNLARVVRTTRRAARA